VTNSLRVRFKNIPQILNSRTLWSKGRYVAFLAPNGPVKAARQCPLLGDERI
jgi:hypothetical protein